MKIVNFKEFAALEAGTIFSYYRPAICEGLYRKDDTIESEGKAIDFFETPIEACCWNGEAPTVDGISGRWGMFDYDQQFAVYEEKDIELMIKLLTF